MQRDANVVLLFITGTLILFLLSLFIIVLVLRYRHRSLQSMLAAEVAAQSYKDQLLFSTIEAAERERERIARDLHDEMGNLLGFTLAKLKTISSEQDTVLHPITLLLEEACTNTRKIAQETFPTLLHMFGLEDSLKRLLEKMRQTIPEAEMSYSLQDVHLPETISLAIYRIIQELCSNTVKYANAKKVAMLLILKQTDIYLKYSDDGIGADLKKVDPGMGLKNIYSRLLLVSGTYEIATQTGKGFIFTATIPLNSLR